MRLILLSLAAILLAGAGASAQQASAPGIEGLWVARSINAPVGGTLLIIERSGGLSADISGFQLPVMANGKALSFALPDGKGSFRGMRSGREIRGQWIQGMTASSGARFSTPVTLRADGPGRWRGRSSRSATR